MRHSSKSQCCVLTGDSASGKTESLKHILLYIISTSIPTQPSLKAKFQQVKLSNLKFLKVSEFLGAWDGQRPLVSILLIVTDLAKAKSEALEASLK